MTMRAEFSLALKGLHIRNGGSGGYASLGAIWIDGEDRPLAVNGGAVELNAGALEILIAGKWTDTDERLNVRLDMPLDQAIALRDYLVFMLDRIPPT